MEVLSYILCLVVGIQEFYDSHDIKGLFGIVSYMCINQCFT